MLLVLAVGIISMPGCSGCNQDPDERLADKIKKEKERQKKKKPKPNFVSPGTAILPGKYPDLDSKTPEDLKELTPEERAAYFRSRFNRVNRTKRGHWLETSTPMIAHNFNQEGQINSVPMLGTGADKVPGTDFEIATTRSFSLVKGQWKYLPSTIFLPQRSQAISANMNVTLSTGNDALPLYTVPLSSSQTMPGFQYHMVVLSSRPQQVRYLQFTDSVRIRQSDLSMVDTPPFYQVVTNQPGRPVPLPRNVLHWTTTAYLIWDDLEPDDLDPDQQQALVDWLHFGGQLILSGPDCLSKLEASFLADYLPAQSEGKTEIDIEAFEPLNENWSVPNRNNAAEKRSLVVTESKPVIGIEFKPHVAASYITGTGSLAIERMIGRGRVVATAFSLTSPTVKSWGSFQSFFNNALLRKPHRKFGERSDVVLFDWANDPSTMYDPLLGSTVRFISRDLVSGGTPYNPNSETALRQQDEQQPYFGEDGMETQPLKLSKTATLKRNTKDTRHYGGFKSDPHSGVGGWSDSGAIAASARKGLKSAAGINPPSADLILKMLGVYLLVLVPVNWLIFRALGKVEWAWAMVPLIAIVGAISVVKVASLDIGFARSNTQVSLLEIHDGYHRGHLSQYSALYTSLSTNYAIELDNATGIALPLSLDRPSRPKVTPQRLWMQQSLTNRTENLQIQSNSTGLLHAEWMQEVGGDFRINFDQSEPDFDNLKLQNTTTVDLGLAGVIARDEQGKYYSGWIGDLKSEDAIDVSMNRTEKFDLPQLWAGEAGLISTLPASQQLLSRFEIDDKNRISIDQIKDSPLLESYLPAIEAQSEINTDTNQSSIDRSQFLTIIGEAKSNETESLVGNLLSVVLDNLELGKGEIRLLGICENQIGNTRFDPESTQSTGQTLVVAHLRQPDLPPAQRDLNSILDFTKIRSNIDRENDFSDESFDGTIEQE